MARAALFAAMMTEPLVTGASSHKHVESSGLNMLVPHFTMSFDIGMKGGSLESQRMTSIVSANTALVVQNANPTLV